SAGRTGSAPHGLLLPVYAKKPHFVAADGATRHGSKFDRKWAFLNDAVQPTNRRKVAHSGVRSMSGISSKLALGLMISAATSVLAGAATGAPRTDWPSVNHDNTSVRYSPLTQINAANVKNLEQQWV